MARAYDSETTASDVVHDVADQINGKVVLTTGVSPGGLGAAFVESVAAAQPALLILAGRSLAKVRARQCQRVADFDRLERQHICRVGFR